MIFQQFRSYFDVQKQVFIIFWMGGAMAEVGTKGKTSSDFIPIPIDRLSWLSMKRNCLICQYRNEGKSSIKSQSMHQYLPLISWVSIQINVTFDDRSKFIFEVNVTKRTIFTFRRRRWFPRKLNNKKYEKKVKCTSSLTSCCVSSIFAVSGRRIFEL